MNNKVTFKPYDMNQLKLPIDLAIDMMKKKMSTFVRITDSCNIREHKQITVN